MKNRLSKDEIAIIRYLVSIEGMLDSNLKRTTKESLATKFSITRIDDVINHLLELGMIDKLETDFKSNSYYFSGTTNAKNILEFIDDDKKERIKWSIQIPIAITIIGNVAIKLVEFLLK